MTGIFTKMLDILDYEIPMETRDKIKLYSLVLESITACLSGCSSSKSAFEAFIGYNKLVRLVFKKVAPCEDVSCLFVCLFVCSFVCLFVCLFVVHLFICLFVCLLVYF